VPEKPTKLERIEKVQRWAYHGLRSVPQRLRASNWKLIREHLSSQKPKKLHLGCGNHILPEWLNTDVRSSSAVAFLDVTARFPFKDETFDYVFTEHVIEHLSYRQGLGMLRESFRVLRPGGKIRVVTPDFVFLKALHNSEKNELQKSYIRSSAEWWLDGNIPAYADMHVINNFMRAWGHQFIYDRQSLSDAFEAAGFSAIQICELLLSRYPALCDLEFEARMPTGYLRLESLIIEGAKPARVPAGSTQGYPANSN